MAEMKSGIYTTSSIVRIQTMHELWHISRSVRSSYWNISAERHAKPRREKRLAPTPYVPPDL